MARPLLFGILLAHGGRNWCNCTSVSMWRRIGSKAITNHTQTQILTWSSPFTCAIVLVHICMYNLYIPSHILHVISRLLITLDGGAGVVALVCKVAIWDTDIAYSCQFGSQMLHFWSTSLLWPGKSSRRWIRYLGSPTHPHGRLEFICWLLPFAGLALALAAFWKVNKKLEEPLCMSVCVCVCNSDVTINK